MSDASASVAVPLEAGGLAAEVPGVEMPEELSGRRLRSRLLLLGALVAAIVAAITLLPGLQSLRSLLGRARPEWIGVAVGLKLLSGLSYVVIFRAVFCRRMSWKVSYQIGMSELGANALFPTGGAGGLALGAWALRRGGVPAGHIARRTVAFFLLTSTANVSALIIVGLGLTAGIFPGHASLVGTLVPAVVAALAIVGTLLAGRLADRTQRRLAHRRPGEPPSRVVKTLKAVADGVDEAFALLRRRDRNVILGSIGYLAFDIMVLWATFHAFGASPHLAIMWIAYLIGELGGLIPLPGGIGGVDAGLIGTFVLYGIPLTVASAAVLAYRAVALWVPAVFGAGAFLWLRRTLRHEASALALCVPGQELDAMGLGPVVVLPAAATGASSSAAARAPTGGPRFAPRAESEDDATVTPPAPTKAANPAGR
ncbi:MAG TPA: lysylphosphatidylglycerol synthase transmembrane domain-containing protein [Solirubrobacteraceae bacterium]|nr:lysylphosphatidylglycerol synthase transmembrane domain-containing protein [Solirubrobacteraceae bacterium]